MMTTRPTDIFHGYDPDPAASMSLHADAYTRSEWFERELRAVFGASWQWLCHVEKLREPGSYVTDEVAGMPVVAAPRAVRLQSPSTAGCAASA